LARDRRALPGSFDVYRSQRRAGKFIDRRPYDPEGLYYYGKTLEQLEQREEALKFLIVMLRQ